mmetsp:Transcript_13683/g.19919  ORF Transcript_13683/g.19919 Transcript_13683/m.19919 type:complete len:512 (-) Transcript_13683:65-1600(-)
MKLSSANSWILSIVSASVVGSSYAQDEVAGMTKMCLFYPNPSGHARSDPILNQVCPADHVHTFYGPENIHPSTTYADLRNTKPQYSSTPWIENQSLYWHPSIYQVTDASNGQKTYTRVNALESSPYYRWNTSTSPETVEFPASFRMIAYSDQVNAGMGGETSQNLFVECCNNVSVGEEEDCTTISMGNPLVFPTRTCDHLGIAMAMPTCWDESKGIGDNGDPFSHVAFTTDGNVGGPCPAGYNKRLPQVQLFVRIADYQGGTYQLSDGNDRWHVDFMNGWRPNKLQEIINDCAPSGEPGYNPPCDCNEQFLTENTQASEVVCDNDVKRFIVNEETAVVSTLPRGTCQGAPLILKSWNADPPFGQCLAVPPGPAPSTNPPSPNPTPQTSTSPTGTLPTSPTPTPCVNNSVFTWTLDNFAVDVNCNWLTKNKIKRNGRKLRYCPRADISSNCPISCNACPNCRDDTDFTFTLRWNKKEVNCDWLTLNKNQIQARRNTYCGTIGSSCPLSCGNC